MKSFLILLFLVAFIDISHGSENHRIIGDSTFQSTRDPQPHGYRDSTEFWLHGFSFGEMSFRVVVNQGTIVDSTLRLELSGRVLDAMTGECLDDVLITIGTIDSAGESARILPFEQTRTSRTGGFTISGSVYSGLRMAFTKAGYLVLIFEIDRLTHTRSRE